MGQQRGVATRVTDPGAPGGTIDRADAESTSPGLQITCTYIPDGSGHANGAPEWELQHPHTGEDGAWFFRSCSDGSFTPVWIGAETAQPGGAPTVTPAELAVQAANYLPLPAPEVHHNPDRSDGRPQTVVEVRTWLWVSASSFRTLRQTTSAGAVSATVTATPVSTFWRTGSADAPDVRCHGPGTPYDPSRPSVAQSTECATTYARSSAGRPQTGPHPNDRFFVATVTTTWRVTWTGTGGAGGTLPDIQRSTRFPLAVAELQAVNR